MATMKTPKNKANNVKDLTITKVDFVDAGANQRANITLFKRDPTKGGEKVSNPVKKFISTMAKRLGISESETAAGIQAIAKDSGLQHDGRCHDAEKNLQPGVGHHRCARIKPALHPGR